MMTSVFIVTIVFGSIVLALAVVCGTILTAMKLRHGGISHKDRQKQTDEARMIQDIYNGLLKMENRVEALETILMDQQERTGKHE